MIKLIIIHSLYLIWRHGYIKSQLLLCGWINLFASNIKFKAFVTQHKRDVQKKLKLNLYQTIPPNYPFPQLLLSLPKNSLLTLSKFLHVIRFCSTFLSPASNLLFDSGVIGVIICAQFNSVATTKDANNPFWKTFLKF